MRFIPTSDAQLAQLRKQAKKLQRASGGKHTELLDQVARAAGYDHWHHALQCNSMTAPEFARNASAAAIEPSQEASGPHWPMFIPIAETKRGDGGHIYPISTFVISQKSPVDHSRAEVELFNSMDNAVRSDDRTVVVDVRLPTVPPAVLAAVRRFAYTGDPIVVVHRGKCSLDSDYKHSREFFDSARRAAGKYGTVWHPIKREFVHRNPIDPEDQID